MDGKLNDMSINQLAPLIKSKRISPVELTDAILQEIDEHNDYIKAYINIYETDAKEQAKRAENEIMNGTYRGPLHGIPMALKDNIYLKDFPVTVGSKIHQHFKPDYDATVVKRLRDNGVIFTGSLNMHEYAMGITTDNPFYGTCRNPWDPNKVPSGSSGGSAAAVSANMTIASLGTETGGSIRTPSSVCGIVGIKPTFGRVSRYGSFPVSSTLDHIGPMAKTVYDSALLLEVIAGHDYNDLSSSTSPVDQYTRHLTGDVSNLIIGICEDYLFNDIDSDVKKLVLQCIEQLEKLGMKIKHIDLTPVQKAVEAISVIMASEGYVVHEENVKNRAEDFGADILSVLKSGTTYSATDYIKALHIQQDIQHVFKSVFSEVDVLVAPTMPFTARAIDSDDIYLNGRLVQYSIEASRLIRPGTLAGIPAITVPCGLSKEMPVGLQVMGNYFDEKTILNVAYAIELMDFMKDRNEQ